MDNTSANELAKPKLLQVVDIFKVLGKRSVLNGLSLSVCEGEILGLFGPDGAGKTISLQCILGLIMADRGRVILQGQDVTPLPFYRRALLGMGYLPQQPSIFRGLTVAQNIMAMIEIVEPNSLMRGTRLDRLLADLGIAHLRDTRATALSGGERRRCEIARSLALEPVIMMLDEPFAGIDPLTIESIKHLILAMKRRGIAVLVTDQNVAVMMELIDRACVIDEGTPIFEGSPQEMLHSPMVIEHYLGLGN
ncbi:LPS export ABC transporter ATP-binding protein [Altererythrobacter gangjinensis]|uniref:LPS export ABC transporter ATP-binding protein n=2 Tax=Pontixanthobacter gangjinensis TaxID=1028742 RepID=A0A6I4SNI7_9SPHN|nr:LPS export ABC transporter ATP-binding protein [Pontixanthobacter gangjinensis]